MVLGADISGLNVAIIGFAAAGKTYLSKAIKTPEHHIIHTDELLRLPVDEGLTELKSLVSAFNPHIVEGMTVYELLLWGAKTGEYTPDIIFDIQITRARQQEIYRKERSPGKIQYLKGFNLKHLSLLNQYLDTVPKEKQAKYIIYENNW